MLEYLRNAADKPVAKILMGILIFSFVGWGVAEWVFGLSSSDTTLMRVGGDKVSVNQYTSMKSNEQLKLSREEQRTLYTDPAAMSAFQDKIIKDIASLKRLEHHARDLGYVVSDRRIVNDIRAVPQFQENGQFSPVAYDVVLRNSGITESDVIADFRMKALNQMVQTPVEYEIQTPRFAMVATYNARNASRTIDLATVKLTDFKVEKPTDDALREFYRQNPHRVAETRDVSYVMISAETDKPDEYEKGLKAAQKLEDDIIGGAGLADAAKEHDAKYKQFEKISSKKLPDDKNIDDAMLARIFGMDEGTESELIETKNGFIIIRVDKITPEHDAEFDSVKKDVESEWTRAEQRKLAYVRANELLVDLNNDGKLTGGKKLTVTRTDGAEPNVLTSAFHNNINENSIVETPDAFYVMHITGEKLPALDDKKLDALKDEVTKMSGEHIRTDYDAYLEREYPIKINDKNYKRFVK